jgi:hypothetical protein
VRHGFTHFELETEVYVAEVSKRPGFKGDWIAAEKLRDVALPTVMRKIVEHGLDAGGPLFAAKPRQTKQFFAAKPRQTKEFALGKTRA